MKVLLSHTDPKNKNTGLFTYTNQIIDQFSGIGEKINIVFKNKELINYDHSKSTFFINHILSAQKFLLFIVKHNATFIYISHNHESTSFYSCFINTKNPIDKLKYFLRTLQYYLLELVIIKKCKYIISISENDTLRYLESGYKKKVFNLKPYYNLDIKNKPLERYQDEIVTLLHGSFLWSIKKENAQNILNTWSKLDYIHKSNLLIVGNGSENLRQLKSNNKYEILGKVKCMAPFLSRSRISIVPEVQKSGIKLKILESAIYGHIIISTEAGIEGTGLIHGVSCIVYKNQEELMYILSSVIQNINEYGILGKKAQQMIREKYSINQFIKSLYEINSYI